MMDFAVKGWIQICVSLFLIGGGGILSTYGWANINKRGQLDSLIFAMCRELIYNCNHFTRKPLAFNEEYDGQNPYLYPTLETSATQAFYTSGLSGDGDLTHICMIYVARANHLNSLFQLANSSFTRNIDPSIRKEKVDNFNENSEPLRSFREVQSRIMLSLKRDYPKQLDEALYFGSRRPSAAGKGQGTPKDNAESVG